MFCYKSIFCVIIFPLSAFSATLNEALKQTFENNLELQAERKNLEIQQEVINMSRSDLLPTLTLTGKKNFEEIAKKRIKVGLILNEFGEQNKIKVNEQELQAEVQKQIRMMPGQEKMVMDFYQKNPSAIASLRGTVYEDKIISLIKEKAKSNKKEISKDEAEKILKQSQNQEHDHSHDNDNKEEKKPTKKAEAKKSAEKKAKSKSPPKKIKKVSKK